MLKGRFFKQLVYMYNPLFPINSKKVKTFVEEHLPSLKAKEYNINFSNQKV